MHKIRDVIRLDLTEGHSLLQVGLSNEFRVACHRCAFAGLQRHISRGPNASCANPETVVITDLAGPFN